MNTRYQELLELIANDWYKVGYATHALTVQEINVLDTAIKNLIKRNIELYGITKQPTI